MRLRGVKKGNISSNDVLFFLLWGSEKLPHPSFLQSLYYGGGFYHFVDVNDMIAVEKQEFL
jgi:hypothetical protein